MPSSARIVSASGGSEDFERNRTVEPGEELVWAIGIQRRALNGDELPRLQLEHCPSLPIGRDPNKMLFLLALAVGEIVGHSPFNVLPFPVEIALCLKNRAPNQSVEPSAHLRHAPLEFKRAEFDLEILDEQLPEVGLDLVVPRSARQVA